MSELGSDADRLAVAEKGSSGDWKIFTGNEIAALLADIMKQKTGRRCPGYICQKAIGCLLSTVSLSALMSNF